MFQTSGRQYIVFIVIALVLQLKTLLHITPRGSSWKTLEADVIDMLCHMYCSVKAKLDIDLLAQAYSHGSPMWIKYYTDAYA